MARSRARGNAMTHDWFSCKPQFISLYETSEIFYGLRETFTDFHRLQRLVETFFRAGSCSCVFDSVSGCNSGCVSVSGSRSDSENVRKNSQKVSKVLKSLKSHNASLRVSRSPEQISSSLIKSDKVRTMSRSVVYPLEVHHAVAHFVLV